MVTSSTISLNTFAQVTNDAFSFICVPISPFTRIIFHGSHLSCAAVDKKMFSPSASAEEERSRQYHVRCFLRRSGRERKSAVGTVSGPLPMSRQIALSSRDSDAAGRFAKRRVRRTRFHHM